jgi:DNA-binding MarR family transcriptional regulator
LSRAPQRDVEQGRGLAFLLSQVGVQSSLLWNERLRTEGFESRKVNLLWNVALDGGRSQRQLAHALRLPASRIVGLVDALEAEGLLERRVDPSDHRTRALHVTRKGRTVLKRIMAISMAHERRQGKGLTPAEREMLIALLGKVAAAQRLAPRSHPDF